jgi:hypothetical protein
MRRLGFVSLGVIALAMPSMAVRAEPLPRPSVDYAAEGTITSGKGSNPATMRYGGGKMRLDTEVEGNKSSIYIDVATHTATVVTHRMGQKIAMQVDSDRAAETANFIDRDARRVGEAKVAGETCNEYEFETAKGRTMRTCISHDGIALRSRDVTRDRVVWEAARVTRAPQNAALFVVPSDAIPLQIQKSK